MNELEPQLNPDEAFERMRSLANLIEQYFPNDKEFILGLDFEEALGFVYGQLLDVNEDPDVILMDCGVIERTSYEV